MQFTPSFYRSFMVKHSILLLPGREQVSRFFPAFGRTAICPARDGAIPYAEAGSW